MLTITHNPENIIPNVRENYIKDKIIILLLEHKETSAKYMYVPEKIDNKFYWHGGCIKENLYDKVSIWRHSDSNSLLELLIWTWQLFGESSSFLRTVYVIGSRTEVINLMSIFKVTNIELIHLFNTYNASSVT